MATSSPTSSRPPAPGARPRWYRSLYWRIGLGFVLTLAAMMAVQALLVVWVLGRGSEAPGPPPRGFERIVARDLSEALRENPALDLERYVREEYQRRLYPFLVVVRDGPALASDGRDPDPAVVARVREVLAARAAAVEAFGDRLRRQPPRFDGSRGQDARSPDDQSPGDRRGGDARDRGGPDDRPRFRLDERTGPGGDGFGDRRGPNGDDPGNRRVLRARPGFPGFPGEIVVAGRVTGMVLALPRSVFAGLGRTLGLIGLVLLVVGTAAASALIFGPVRRRLSDLEAAALRVAEGQLSARAREDGGDEVASLARTFNHMAAELDQRAEEAAEAERARRQLLADVSHELMTPLTSMRGYLETLGMPAMMADAEARTRYLGIVSDESRRLEHIIGDLLELARLEGGGGSLDVQDVPVESLFGRVRDRHEREASAKGVVLETDIAPGAEIVQGDARRLEQALQNLVANALRHTPPHGVVRLGSEADGPDLVITVRDSGEGIPPEHLPHVFDRFYKIDPARGGEASGSGLGLSIVKAIVERHGGRVAIASAPGAGTTFTLRMPLTPEL